MKWSELPFPWQVCFEEGLRAYQAGSVPIGAALLDDEGQLLSRGRNHIFDQDAPEGQLCGHKLAHAELNAILTLRNPDIDFRTSVLYTGMEPCPLCMGAIYMAGIRTVYYAARDPYAGSVNLLGATPYFSRKNVRAVYLGDVLLENLIVGLNTEFGLRGFYNHVHDFFDVWKGVLRDGVAFGRWLHKQDYHKRFAASGQTASQTFEILCTELIRMETN